jgi:hypothetical protein
MGEKSLALLTYRAVLFGHERFFKSRLISKMIKGGALLPAFLFSQKPLFLFSQTLCTNDG